MRDEHLREDAKQLLRVSYERQAARGEVGLRVDLRVGAEERGLSADSPHLASLVDYMEVAGWIKQDPDAFDVAGGVHVKGGGFDRTVSTVKMKAGDAALNGISENF
jgi:hypothetical protein